MTRTSFGISIASAALATILAVSFVSRVPVAAQAGVAVDADDIGGVVSGARGPEAGVWVIAESTNLATTLRKIVVTDDQGRYLVPDLPKANYNVWVRGYGLVDSPKQPAAPGKTVNLTACPAGVKAQPPLSTIWLDMNLPLYSPIAPAGGWKPG